MHLVYDGVRIVLSLGYGEGFERAVLFQFKEFDGDEIEQMVGRQMQGFTAVFDQQSKDIDEASRTKNYYLIEVDEATGEKTIVNSERFTIAVINQFGGDMGALTRGGSIWSKIGGWFEDAWNAIKDTFCYIFGIDFTNETLNAEK